MAQVYRRKAVRKDERANTNMLDFASGLFEIAGEAYQGVQQNIKNQEILQQKQQEEEERKLNQLQEDYVKRIEQGEIIDQEYLVADLGNKRASEVNEISNGARIAKRIAEQTRKKIDSGEIVVGQNQSPIDLYRQTLKNQELTRNQLRGANIFLTNNANSILKSATKSLSDNSKLKFLESFTASVETSSSTILNNTDLSAEEKFNQFNQSYYQFEDEMVSQGLDIKDVRNKFYDYIESIADEDQSQVKFLIESLGTRTTKDGKQVRGFTKTDQRYDELIKKKEVINSLEDKLLAERTKNRVLDSEYISENLNTGNVNSVIEDKNKINILYENGYATAKNVVEYEDKATKETINKIGNDVLRSAFLPTKKLDPKTGEPVTVKQSEIIESYLTNGKIDINKIKKNLPYIKKLQKEFNILDADIVDTVKKSINVATGKETISQDEYKRILRSVDINDTSLLFTGDIMNTTEEQAGKFIKTMGRRVSIANSIGVNDTEAQNFYDQITFEGNPKDYNNMASTYSMLKLEYPNSVSRIFSQSKINEIENYLTLRERAKVKMTENNLSLQENISLLKKEARDRQKEGSLINQSNETMKEQNVSKKKIVEEMMGLYVDEDGEIEVAENRSWYNQFFGSDFFTDTAKNSRTYNDFINSHMAGITKTYNEGGYENYQDAARVYSQRNRLKERTIVVGNNQIIDVGLNILNQYQDSGNVESNIQDGVDGIINTFDDLQSFIESSDEITNIALLNSSNDMDLSEKIEIRNTYDPETGEMLNDSVHISIIGDEDGTLLNEILTNPATRQFLMNTTIGQKVIESQNNISIHDLYDYNRQNNLKIQELNKINRKRAEERANRTQGLPSLQPKL